MNTKHQVLYRKIVFFVSLKLNMRKFKNKKTSHTEAHITKILTKISYKMSKYLNKNQALFRHKSHMAAELYLIYILGIQANWEN